MAKLGQICKLIVNKPCMIQRLYTCGTPTEICGRDPRDSDCHRNRRRVMTPHKPASCKVKKIPLTRQEKCLVVPPEKIPPCGQRKSAEMAYCGYHKAVKEKGEEDANRGCQPNQLNKAQSRLALTQQATSTSTICKNR